MHFAIQNLMLHTHITVQIASCKQTADKILITAKYIGSILSKQASTESIVCSSAFHYEKVHTTTWYLFVVYLVSLYCQNNFVLYYTTIL